uniref:Uncharacterized protein n=1 Tax=Histophilus somni (strain 129Pt) TaxID=205914 RepID=Q0I4P7_HISS1
MENKQIKKLLSKIDNLQPEYYGFEQVIYSALELLNEREEVNFNKVANWLKDTLNNYSENEVFSRICQKIDELIKNNPDKEKDFLSDSYLLGELTEDQFKYDIDKCCEYLEELNPVDWIEWHQWLDDWLYHKYSNEALPQIPMMPNAKDYELMAILALDYVKEAIEFNDPKIQMKYYERYSLFRRFDTETEFIYLRRARAVREVISAFISINRAKELKSNINIKEMESSFIKKP